MIPNSYAKVFLTCLITAGAAASQSKIKDVILQKSGQRIRGVEVVEMTSSTIKYRDGDEEKEILASALARVQWYEPPESFMLATAAVARGKFAEAANLYSEAIRGTERRALKQEAEFLAAEALVKSSGVDQVKATAAVKALNDYLTSTPDGYRLPDTLLLLGKAMVFAGKQRRPRPRCWTSSRGPAAKAGTRSGACAPSSKRPRRNSHRASSTMPAARFARR